MKEYFDTEDKKTLLDPFDNTNLQHPIYSELKKILAVQFKK